FMSKIKSGKHYPKDLIAQVINDYAGHVRPAKQLADYYGIPYNTVKYWIKKYNKNGMDALLKPRSGGKYITYDPSFKLRVTEYWLEHPEVSSSQISEMFHASRGAIRSWRKIYLEQGADALRKEMRGKSKNMKNGKRKIMAEQAEMSDSPQKRIETLEKQVRYLQMENDYLKKLNALVQEKEHSQKPKKQRL
ncbi:helix-turn-helix domain-containing protein, partial [Lachnospiraceae bacterium]|nr:helix-turn-helix domain-containing protein [Lachnospiraceae bacterium]